VEEGAAVDAVVVGSPSPSPSQSSPLPALVVADGALEVVVVAVAVALVVGGVLVDTTELEAEEALAVELEDSPLSETPAAWKRLVMSAMESQLIVESFPEVPGSAAHTKVVPQGVTTHAPVSHIAKEVPMQACSP